MHASALLSANVPQPSDSPVPVARPFMPAAETILPYLERIDAKRWYSNFGPLLMELEARLAARFTRPTLTCTAANGTQALTLALMALDAKPGGLCVMPSWTFALRASDEEWTKFWSPPRPGSHDLMALIKRRVLKAEGDLQPFMANLRYFKEALVKLRKGDAA